MEIMESIGVLSRGSIMGFRKNFKKAMPYKIVQILNIYRKVKYISLYNISAKGLTCFVQIVQRSLYNKGTHVKPFADTC